MLILFSTSGATFGRDVQIQLIALILGLVTAIVLSLIDYRTLARFWPVLTVLGVGLVVLTFFIGIQREGADDRAWIALPGNFATIQPTEFYKIAFIVTFAKHLDAVHENINSWKTFGLLIAHACFPLLLIHLQGDDGTALVFFATALIMIFASGIKLRYIGALAGVGVVSIPIAWFFVLSDMQRTRILDVLLPSQGTQNSTYQAWQGRVAIGSGQLFGRGLFNGPRTQGKLIPEVRNDFIFAGIGEELGFVGCILVIFLLFAICIRCLLIARRASDPLGSSICIGVFSILFIHTFINIGMCLSITPVIGIPLPFFSSGGSSMLSVMLLMGLLQSVYLHNRPGMFAEHL